MLGRPFDRELATVGQRAYVGDRAHRNDFGADLLCGFFKNARRRWSFIVRDFMPEMFANRLGW